MIRDQRLGFNETENGVDVRVGGRGGYTGEWGEKSGLYFGV